MSTREDGQARENVSPSSDVPFPIYIERSPNRQPVVEHWQSQWHTRRLQGGCSNGASTKRVTSLKLPPMHWPRKVARPRCSRGILPRYERLRLFVPTAPKPTILKRQDAASTVRRSGTRPQRGPTRKPRATPWEIGPGMLFKGPTDRHRLGVHRSLGVTARWALRWARFDSVPRALPSL